MVYVPVADVSTYSDASCPPVSWVIELQHDNGVKEPEGPPKAYPIRASYGIFVVILALIWLQLEQ
jgi:hypothetical protein